MFKIYLCFSYVQYLLTKNILNQITEACLIRLNHIKL